MAYIDRNGEKYWIEAITDAIARRSELNHLDFKEDLSEKRTRLIEHVNAFGNTPGGGAFVFGITRSFKFSKTALDFDKIATEIVNIAKDKQEPGLSVESHILKINGHFVLCAHVQQGVTSPVFIKDRAPFGGNASFKRNGSQTITMSIDEIREHLAKSRNVSADEMAIDASSLDDLDFGMLGKIFQEVEPNRPIDENLVGKLLDNQICCGPSAKPKLTIAGALSFTSHPQKFGLLRNAYIEFQVFRTNLREEPLKVMTIDGNLANQLLTSVDLVKQYVWSMPKIVGVQRQDIPAYNDEVLREVIANAVVHRDYRKVHHPIKIAMFMDRLEIENPGGLMPGLSTLNLIHNRAWRNPVIATHFKKLGYGEMDGQGIDRICVSTRHIKVPAPIFYSRPTAFKVTLSAPKSYEEFSPEEKRLTAIILLIMENQLDNERIRNAFGINQSQASTLLKSLAEEGIIRTVSKSRKFAKYKFTESYAEQIYG